MKRLIKKAKYYTTGETNELLLEVFIDPTSKEIKDVKVTSELGSVRGVIVDGNTYIWRGDILHNDINKYLPRDKQIDINQFRFAYEDDYGWTIDTHGGSWQESIDLISKNLSKLNKIDDINEPFHIFNGPRNFLGITTIDEIENGTSTEKSTITIDELIIFKNPNQQEINKVTEFDESGLCGTVVNNSDICVWGIDEPDEDIEDYLGQSLEFKFLIYQNDPNSIVFINSYYGTWKSLTDLIIKNESKLATIIDIDNMILKFKQDFKDKVFDSTTLSELKEYKMESAYNQQQYARRTPTRLIKKYN